MRPRLRAPRRSSSAFHAPAFCRSGMGPIPESQNPHKIIASYAKDLDIVVFNGHVHTTELYEVDGVKYLLLGGGGAEQDPILPGRTLSRCLRAIRRICIGRASLPRRNTTTCSWTCNPDRRRSSRSIASGRGRLSRSRPWKCSSKSAAAGGDVGYWQCAPKARITSGGRFPPRELSIDLVADERFGRVTGRTGAS